MNRKFQRTLSFVLLLSALMSLCGFSAYAGLSDAVVGKSYSCFIVQTPADSDENTMESAQITDGAAPGLSLVVEQGSSLYLRGTPTQVGSYTMSYTVTYKDGHTGTGTLSLKVTEPAEIILSQTINMTVGTNYNSYVYEGENGGSGGTTGTLPDGIKEVVNSGGWGLSGTPTKPGVYSVTHVIKSVTAEGGANIRFTLTIKVEEAPAPVVTKDPTKETVDAGGKAIFIARADNAKEIIWRLVSPDQKLTYNADEAPKYFFGLKVIGQGTETLTLENIPVDLNGWKVEAKFTSLTGDNSKAVISKGALLTVKPAQPVISTQPGDVSKKLGESVTLTVTANDPNNGTLRYQWYSSSTNSTTGGTPVPGANSETLNVPQQEGTFYYFVKITSTKGEATSEPTVSRAAAVTLQSAEAAVTPTPAPTATPVPTVSPTDTPSVTPVVTPSPTVPSSGVRKTNSLFVVIIILLVVAMAACGALIFLNAKAGAAEKMAAAEAASAVIPTPADFWICPGCGEHNKGRFCPSCGERKPAVELQYACDKCGWEPEDPRVPPKFCPNCGDPFGDEDIVKK